MDLSTEQCIIQLQQMEQNLKDTLEAQKALQDNIPYYLEKNLICLKKYFPNLHSKFKDYKLERNYKLTCNSNGEPNIVYPDGHFFYSQSPFSDCQKQVNEFLDKFYDHTRIANTIKEKNSFNQLHFHFKNDLSSKVIDLEEKLKDQNLLKKNINTPHPDSVPLLCMFGLGLGFQLGYLYEKFTPINIYIIEPNIDFFYLSLCVFDYTPLIEYINTRHLGLKFFIDNDDHHLLNDFNTYIGRYETNLPVVSYFYHYNSEKIIELQTKLENNVFTIQVQKGFFDDILIGMCHSRQNITNNERFLKNTKQLPQEITSVPVFVIGNGPSLDNELELIKKNNEKVYIIACGTALTALSNYGITADIYVAVERTPDVYNSLLSIKNPNVFEHTLCIAPDTIYPNVLSLFKHKVLGFKPIEAMYTSLSINHKLTKYKEYSALTMINPLVSNMGLMIASLLKFKNIYLVGVDCGTAYEETHSKYSLYFDNFKAKQKNDDNPLNFNTIIYPGNFEETIKTNNLFKCSINVMELAISSLPKCSKVYNASNGARIKGSIPKHLSEIDFDSLKKTTSICNFINTEMSSPIEYISDQDFADILKIDRSMELIDILIEDLKKLPSTRAEIILRLESHLDFINDWPKEGLAFCQDAIIGSISHLYIGYITALYLQPEERKAIKDADILIPTIIDFLQKAKEYLPLTYEYSYEFVRNNIKPPL